MKVLKSMLMVSLGLIIFFSCKKGDTGPQGAVGEKGEKGEQGAKGIQGLKGGDGATIFSGDAVPVATLGKAGDYYIRKATSEMYGPKTDAGWGQATSFKGATGANGTAGSKILSGTQIPAVSVGAVGDFYFKVDSYQFFGPKTASGWGTGVNLRGATGTANVLYSGWQSATGTKDSTIDGTTVRIAHLAAKGLSTTILSSGTVIVYLDYGGGIYPLPYTSRAGGRMSTISHHPKENRIIVYRFVYDGGSLVALAGQIVYRYVIIPGGTMASLKRKGVDLNDANQVEAALKSE
ncbi:hypothetical protein GCM10009120_49680 [Sphingobacterium siyangense subsp. cladoniae]|uniref:collagen-like protein n=1 Tax=Sphingobacterium siyangense TaxID=459529 RepID=UPI0031F7DD13